MEQSPVQSCLLQSTWKCGADLIYHFTHFQLDAREMRSERYQRGIVDAIAAVMSVLKLHSQLMVSMSPAKNHPDVLIKSSTLNLVVYK